MQEVWDIQRELQMLQEQKQREHEETGWQENAAVNCDNWWAAPLEHLQLFPAMRSLESP